MALLEPHLPRAQGAIRPEELAQLIQNKQVVAVDTRDAGSFGRAHIVESVNMPLEGLGSRLAELHMLGTPVIYCRSGEKAKEFAENLAVDGIDVPFLEGGFHVL